MFRHMSVTCAVLLFCVCGLLSAAEGATEAPKAEEPKAEAQDAEKDLGDKFTTFWIHDVGDTIYRGLRGGTRRIENAFTGGDKDRDRINERRKIALEKEHARTEIEKAKAAEREAAFEAREAREKRERLEKEAKGE